MKNFFMFLVSIISWLLISCTHNTKAIADNQNSNSNKQDKDIPLVFQSGKAFSSFINNSNIEYVEKEKQITDFFEKRDKYNQQSVNDSFANIASTVQWDVDLINQFQHEMKQDIKRNPYFLCDTVKNLSQDSLEKFSTFYFSGVIWNDEFPEEVYYLKSCNQDAFKIFIKRFSKLHAEMSNNKYEHTFVINDKDGQTNIRMSPKASSDIVGNITNGNIVKSLWKKNNWVFIKNSDNIGYVYLSNIQPKKLDNDFYGKFSFEMSGLNPLTGDGPYQVHTVEISKDSCKVDIVGYQADRHFSCYTNLLSADAIEVYQSDNNKKYGTIHKENNMFMFELGFEKNKYMMETVKD